MRRSQTRLDRAGATLSIICAIHCLATPLILVSLPAAARHSEAAEALIVGASLSIGLSAIRASRRRNGSLLPRVGIGLGLAAIAGSRLLLHSPLETILVFTGAAILATAHLFNCRECHNGCVPPPQAESPSPSRLILPVLFFVACAGLTPASAQPIEVAAAPNAIVAAVSGFVGWPYRLGGNSARGLDCSALVQRAFRAVGLELPRTAAEQFRHGCAVERQELATGDLVFFRGTRHFRSIVHVGIYIGGARFVHAGRHGVVVASLDTVHWARRFAGARRMIEAAPAAIPEGDSCVNGNEQT